MKDDERGAVAGGECRYGFEDTIFSSRGLGGVASQEVVASLLRSEFGYRGEDTKGIASQHDNVAGLSLDLARNLCVGNKFDWVCAAGIFSDADIVVVGCAGYGIVYDIFENGTKSNGVVNFRLLFGRQVDTLCVTASLNVEDTSI